MSKTGENEKGGRWLNSYHFHSEDTKNISSCVTFENCFYNITLSVPKKLPKLNCNVDL